MQQHQQHQQHQQGLSQRVGSNYKRNQFKNLFTCVVGQKPSSALYFVDEVEDVLELLGRLQHCAALHSRRVVGTFCVYCAKSGHRDRGIHSKVCSCVL